MTARDRITFSELQCFQRTKFKSNRNHCVLKSLKKVSFKNIASVASNVKKQFQSLVRLIEVGLG